MTTMKKRYLMFAGVLTLAASAAFASDNSNQPAIDACIDALNSSGKAAAPGGTVLNSSFSEAGTEVILEGGGGVVWRCIAYSDGAVGVLDEATPEQAEAARSAPNMADFQERVRFDSGATGAILTRTLEPGGAFQFILDARENQFLSVRLSPHSGEMYYVIRNPDGSILLDGTDSETPYKGQLWQSGEHIVEVVNKTSADVTYDISFEIE